jgi:hypothetical protein
VEVRLVTGVDQDLLHGLYPLECDVDIPGGGVADPRAPVVPRLIQAEQRAQAVPVLLGQAPALLKASGLRNRAEEPASGTPELGVAHRTPKTPGRMSELARESARCIVKHIGEVTVVSARHVGWVSLHGVSSAMEGPKRDQRMLKN